MARPAEHLQPARPERIPPHNLEAEESVLGSMLLSAEAIGSVTEVLRPEDFYRSANEKIYRACLDLYGRGEPVDAITVVEELKRRDQLGDVGGHLYIHNLVESVPTTASAGFYAKIVAEHALLRRLIDAGSKIITKAYSIPEDPKQAADEAEGLVYAVSRHRDQEEVVPLSTLIHDSIETLEKLHERESAFAGVATGFADLDQMTSGLQPGNLIVVAARPGVGKSSLVTNLARNVAVDAGVPVAMFSLEMSRWEIGMRLLCAEARVPWDKIRSARVGPEDWHHIVEGAEALHEAPLHVIDAGNVNIVDIRAKARRLKGKDNLGLIIVDYLQLMSSHTRQREPPDGDRRDQPLAEAAGQGARDPGHRRLPAQPRPGAPPGQAAPALGPAGVRAPSSRTATW